MVYGVCLCVSMTIPQGSDLHRECVGYSEKMKLALATYQVCHHYTASRGEGVAGSASRDLSSTPHPLGSYGGPGASGEEWA